MTETRPSLRRRFGHFRFSFSGAAARAILVVLSLLLPACDRDASAGAAEKVRLEFWTLSLRPHFDDYMNGLVAEFERKNPGIDVAWVDVPYDAVQRKFVAAAAAGRSPDVVNLSDGQFARFSELGAFADLTDLLPGDAVATYHPGAMRLCRLNGRLYGVPWYLVTPVMFANRDLLAAGGLKPDSLARDWGGLAAQAREFRGRTGKFLFMPQLGDETDLPAWMLQEGLPIFRSKEGRSPGLRANLSDPRVVAFVERWVKDYRDGVFPRAAATAGHASKIEHYQLGQTATLVTGANFMQRMRDASPAVYEASVVLPPPTWGDGRQSIDTQVLAVSSLSKHPREAAALAWFVTSAESQLAFCRIVNILPSTPAALDDPHFAAPPAEARGTPEGRLAEARHLSATLMRDATSWIPALSTWPALRDAFQEQVKRALLDGQDLRRTLAEIEREWQSILDSAVPAGMDAIPGVAAAGRASAAGN